jgi:hypothetical protein
MWVSVVANICAREQRDGDCVVNLVDLYELTFSKQV